MLFGAHIKKALVSWFTKKCVAHFPGTCALFSQRNSIFHSLHPVHHLHTRLQFISCDFQNFCPSSPKPPPSNCPKRKRLCGEEGNFLKCLIFLRVRGMVNLRNDLSVSPDDSMQLRNKLETVSMRERWVGEGDSGRLCQLFHFFLSLFLFLPPFWSLKALF